MSRTLGPLGVVVMVAMIALTSAGCLNGSAGNDDSGSSTGVAIGSSSGSKSTGKHAKAVRFAECMRAHGVSAFPDPDASGDLTLDGVVNGSSVNPDGAAWKQAMSACKHLQPSGFAGTKATAKQMSARLKFAQCIRDHGVKDFPDPTKDGPIVDTNRIPSSGTPSGMSALNAAMHTCGSIIASELSRS